MYPSNKFPAYGIFVKCFCEQIRKIGFEMKLSVLHKQVNIIKKVLSYIIFYLNTIYKLIFTSYDLIYIHYPSYSSIPVLFVSKLIKKPIYTNVHGTDVLPINRGQMKHEPNTAKALKISDKVIVPSAFFKEVVIEKYKYPTDNIIIYPSGGVNSKLFYEYNWGIRDQIKNNLLLYGNKKIVGFVSRLNKEKGWDLYLSVAAKVTQKRDDILFVLVGSGQDDREVDILIKKLNLEKNFIKFPGQPHSDLPKFYNCFDVFVFPTRAAESLGLVAIEAMACGTPIIASNYGAPRFYVKDGYNGFKFEVNNVDDLQAKLEYILDSDSKLYIELREGAKATASAYSDTNALKILRGIFNGI